VSRETVKNLRWQDRTVVGGNSWQAKGHAGKFRYVKNENSRRLFLEYQVFVTSFIYARDEGSSGVAPLLLQIGN